MYSNLHFTEHSMEDTIDKVKRIKSPINDKIQQLGEAMDILKQDITILGIRYKLLIFLSRRDPFMGRLVDLLLLV